MNSYQPKSLNTISVYESKDRAEKIFSEKIQDFVKNDPIANKYSGELIEGRKDKWEPKAYMYYEFLRKHPELNESENLAKKYDPIEEKMKYQPKKYGTEEINALYRSQNLNELKLPSLDKIEEKRDRYTSSDIHHLKGDDIALNKYSEYYMFKPHVQIKNDYNRTTESHSDYISKDLKMRRNFNSHSTSYNILAPNYKNFLDDKRMIIDSQEDQKTNYKIGSLSNFVDAIRVTAPNHNQVFLNSIQNNDKIFRRYNECGCDQGNLYLSYRERMGKPFTFNKYYP
ncbi:MAG: hypothetical protein MJ252_26505 [archaeon]|nr:hypothetical protein [archaeon]